MTNSTSKYFQISPEILIEYNYTDTDVVTNAAGDVSKYIFDMWESNVSKVTVINNNYDASNNFLFLQDRYKNHFVTPLNTSESKFVKGVNVSSLGNTINVWDSTNTYTSITNKGVSNLNDNTDDIIVDNFRLHFTSKNFMGDYDGIIIQVSVYDVMKNKISLLSYLIEKTDTLVLNPSPMIINQKMYTTYLDFAVPSISAMMSRPTYSGESIIKNALLLDSSYRIMDNTPLYFSIYGVKSTYNYNNGFDHCNVEKLNTIYIPVSNNNNNCEIRIEEASDGDYFKITPHINGTNITFADYVSKISDGRDDVYVILHEISLTEHLGSPASDVETHKEQRIINVKGTNGEINRIELDNDILFRPVIINSANIVSFTIKDKVQIINTLDNTSIEMVGSITYDSNPRKYGKHMSKINLGVAPAQVSVYNKKPDIDTDGIKLTNGGSNVTIENHQHSIIGFIESVNVGVSIEQIPVSTINEQ